MVKKNLALIATSLLSMHSTELAVERNSGHCADNINIEKLNPNDIHQTESVFHNGFLAAYGRFKSEEIGISGDIQSYLQEWFIDLCHHVRHCENPLYCLVAKHNDTIVGYTVFELLDDQGTVYLYNIVVDPAFHGKGIGTQLVNAISDTAPTRKIIAHTRNVNTSAAFYKKLGFIESTIKSPYYQELAHLLVGFELVLPDNK